MSYIAHITNADETIRTEPPKTTECMEDDCCRAAYIDGRCKSHFDVHCWRMGNRARAPFTVTAATRIARVNDYSDRATWSLSCSECGLVPVDTLMANGWAAAAEAERHGLRTHPGRTMRVRGL